MLLIVKFSKCTSDETFEFLSVLRLDIIKSKQFSMKINQYQKKFSRKKTHTHMHIQIRSDLDWHTYIHTHLYTINQMIFLL